jgi:hypothetical protein
MIPLWVWRLAPYALGVVIVVVAAMGALHNAKEEGRAELKPEIERLEAALSAERSDRARAEAAADSYRSEMDALRNRPVPRTPVRLCVNADPMPANGPASKLPDDSTAITWGDVRPAPNNLAAGPDIGADLYALARDCDAEIAKLRALQGWVNDVR